MEKFQEGIPGLFTPDGFRIAWTEYQGMMLEKLNALTAGMSSIPLRSICLISGLGLDATLVSYVQLC
jgi:hypothetical protein